MTSNEVNAENSNVSGSKDTYTDTNVTLNAMVLLVRVKHVNVRPIEPSYRGCTYTNLSHTPPVVEIVSSHEICLIYKQGIIMGHVAGELMAIEFWMDFPILVTIVIILK